MARRGTRAVADLLIKKWIHLVHHDVLGQMDAQQTVLASKQTPRADATGKAHNPATTTWFWRHPN